MATPSVTLTHDIYTSEAIQQAITAFSHLCRVTISTCTDETVISVTSDRQSDADIAREFLNYALALSAEQQLA